MNDQRYESIKHYASTHDSFTIEELSKQLNVSVTTIRRDVAFLAKQGLVTKYYGKIVWNGTDKAQAHDKKDVTAESRGSAKAEKSMETRMARAAAALVEDNDYIFIESGAYVSALMAKYITKKNVTAVTSDLQIAISLLQNESLNVICLGGHAWRGSYLLYGDITERALSGMHFNKYFTLPGAITNNGDVMYYDSHTGGMRKLLRQVSDTVIVFSIKMRLGRSAFLTIGCVDDCDIIIAESPKEEFPPIHNPKVRFISISPEAGEESGEQKA